MKKSKFLIRLFEGKQKIGETDDPELVEAVMTQLQLTSALTVKVKKMVRRYELLELHRLLIEEKDKSTNQ